MKKGRIRRKVNIFFIFLVSASLAWLVSQLSEDYTQGTSFDLVYINIPDTLRLNKASKDNIDVRLRASGFQFLGFNFRRKQIAIDLSKLNRRGTRYYIPQSDYRRQIQNQLTASMTLLEADRDTLFFEFYKVFKREVPVQSAVTINLGQNFLLEEEVSLIPNSVVLMGPREEIEAVNFITTANLELSDITSDFVSQVALSRPEGLQNTTYSIDSVEVSGRVFRFSEKIIDIPIRVINLPEGTAIRTFPDAVSVLCKGKIDKLKDLNTADFEVIGDYDKVSKSRQMLELKLTTIPDIIHSAKLLESEVEFILKRE